MLVIIGKSASGKSRVIGKLENHGFKKIIRYTDRPKRENFVDDDYIFLSQDDFCKKIKEGFFAEWNFYNTVHGVWYYGTSIDSLKNASDKDVVILTPKGYKQVRDELGDNVTVVYLYANNATIKKRLSKRGDDKAEIDRRIQADLEDFKDAELLANRIVYNNYDDDINDVVDKIVNVFNAMKAMR